MNIEELAKWHERGAEQEQDLADDDMAPASTRRVASVRSAKYRATAALLRECDAHRTHGIEREVLDHPTAYPCSHPGCLIWQAREESDRLLKEIR